MKKAKKTGERKPKKKKLITKTITKKKDPPKRRLVPPWCDETRIRSARIRLARPQRYAPGGTGRYGQRAARERI